MVKVYNWYSHNVNDYSKTCYHCGARLEFTHRDVYKNGSRHWIECPVCKKNVILQ